MSRFVEKEIKRLMGKGIHTKDMIQDGDHILVGISGGKDSLALLWLLRERIRRIPIDYKLTAVHVDPGFGVDSAGQMESFFSEHGFDYRIIRTDIGPKAHSPENMENPCFLCSRLRRKILFETAREIGSKKIAFGHHKDDIIETLFLSIFYGASISTMKPVQDFFDGKLTVIRPFFMTEESLIIRYVKKIGLTEIDLGCPTSGSSKREAVREMLKSFYRTNRKIKGNIFHALHNVRMDYLL